MFFSYFSVYVNICQLRKCYSLLLQFDIDGDGSITSGELRHAMIKLLGEQTSQNEIEAVVKEADNNGDGTVDFEGELQGNNVQTHTHKHTHTN